MALTTSVDDVAPDVVRMRTLFANLYFLGNRDGWVLLDAGVPGTAGTIIEAAGERFGEENPPQAYILTHGHFDHVGAFPEQFATWDVPIYAHELELPHLTGQQDYNPPDPSVGGGAMALLSFAYPERANDFGERVRPLPADGSVPHLPDWRWIHVPGHTAGQVALFRERDRVLLPADAFVTVEQESLYKVATQKQEVHGPPAYFTPDWTAARRSVEALAALGPAIAATGHGTPMSGTELTQGLGALIAKWDEIAVPDHGRYVPESNE